MLPQDQWPRWAKMVLPFATSADSGLGDTVERLIDKSNSENFQMLFKKFFNRPCGCSFRKDAWNRAYPLSWGKAES